MLFDIHLSDKYLHIFHLVLSLFFFLVLFPKLLEGIKHECPVASPRHFLDVRSLNVMVVSVEKMSFAVKWSGMDCVQPRQRSIAKSNVNSLLSRHFPRGERGLLFLRPRRCPFRLGAPSVFLPLAAPFLSCGNGAALTPSSSARLLHHSYRSLS